MALRTRSTTDIGGSENPRKVEAKVVQGPVLRRAALGEVGNKANKVVSRKETDKVEEKKSYIATRKGSSTLAPLNRVGKENIKPSSGTEPLAPKPEVHAVVKKDLVSKNDAQEVEKVEKLSHAFSSLSQCMIDDIDVKDRANPFLVAEYVNDIYIYLRSLEDSHKVSPRYLDGRDISGKMRSILVDWLVQVHLRFNLMQETLYLAIAIIDRFLQRRSDIRRNQLQLVGITAMFLASKYEEMYSPEIGDFSYITDKAYTKAEIRKMEIAILTELEYHISYPLQLHFLRRNSKAGSVDSHQHTLAKYLMELCLPEYSMCHYKASEIAAACLCISRKLLLDRGMAWSQTLAHYSNYSESEITPIMGKIAAIIQKSSTSKLQAVRGKYKTSKHMKISLIPELEGELITQLAEAAALP